MAYVNVPKHSRGSESNTATSETFKGLYEISAPKDFSSAAPIAYGLHSGVLLRDCDVSDETSVVVKTMEILGFVFKIGKCGLR